MELKDFIKDTISQIDSAIRELNHEEDEKEKQGPYLKMIVNPCLDSKYDAMVDIGNTTRKITKINYHINLGIEEGNKINAKIGVLASVVGLGVKGENNNTSHSVTSIDFSLDVLFHEGQCM